ncbi:MAG: hypothetical protein KBC95_03105 [Candidatus Peribacteraceae bacterium]|nr:hypothetical protein [Candidatus Peribacteraceae bacterium]
MSTLNGWERLPTSECVAFRKVMSPYRLEVSGIVRGKHIEIGGYFGGLAGRGTSLHVLAMLTPEQLAELKDICVAELGDLPTKSHDGRPV